MLYNKIINTHSDNRTLAFVLTLGLVIASCFTHAQTPDTESLTRVYKVVNPDGSVSYSDQPQHNAEEMLVKPVPTVPALKIDGQTHKQKKPTTKPLATPYTKLEITKPTPGSAFYSAAPNIQIAIAISPKLKAEHSLRYSLDGTIRSTQRSTQLVLNEIYRGTHSLKVEVIDAQEKVLKSSTSNFTIHRPIARPAKAPVGN